MPRKPPMSVQEKMAAGVCTLCGCRPPAPDRKLCPKCLKSSLEKWHRKTAARKAKGLCVRCGKQPPRPERTECAACAARWKEKYNPKGKARAQKRYRSRVAAGLCTSCGKAEPLPERRKCPSCNEKSRARDQSVRQSRRANGLCTECGAPSPGTRICPKCRDWKRNYDAQALPVWEPRYAVFVLATGDCLGTFDSREDVALCLAFAKLDRDAVEIVTDAPAIAGLIGWN